MCDHHLVVSSLKTLTHGGAIFSISSNHMNRGMSVGSASDNYSHEVWTPALWRHDHHLCHINHSLTLTSRSESRNLSWRFVSMCSWFPASRSACSLLLGMAVWSLGASSMSISTSCQKWQQQSDNWALVALPLHFIEKGKWDEELRVNNARDWWWWHMSLLC